MDIWRIHLKSDAKNNINPRNYCLENGLVGVGWKIEHNNEPVTWESYFEKGQNDYGDSSWCTALDTLKNRIQINDLIWTRDLSGNYFLGRISSEWFYDTSQSAINADIVNVRNCDWFKIGTIEAVAGKVINSFRAPRVVQRIVDENVMNFSKNMFNQRLLNDFYEVENISKKDIFSYLSPDDCEDALGIFLQVKYNYLIIPSSCKKDTMAYEFELKDRITGKKAVVQVKMGASSIDIDEYIDIESDVLLFATSNQYYGILKTNITLINPEIIREFLYQETHLLPEKMRVWIELTR